MDTGSFFSIVNSFIALPSTFLFLIAGFILTLKTNFVQFRALPRFFELLRHGFKKDKKLKKARVLGSFTALFTAMASTIGMGNVVGPSIALMLGGPGALFWLSFYPFFGGAFKFVEATFAISTRAVQDNFVSGGPKNYLSLISPVLGTWYALGTLFIFMIWSSLQSNTLGCILAHESIPPVFTGFFIAFLLATVLFGGVKRIGAVARILVPIMFVLYVFFAFIILYKQKHLLFESLKLIVACAFCPAAPIGGFLGASVFQALQNGIYKSIFITEAGLGTSSIAHALADVEKPTDQGILALFSIIADTVLSFLSGLISLVTGVWVTKQGMDNTVIYLAFKQYSPFMGNYVLLLGVFLFVLTTIIGNSFNGSQIFTSLFGNRFIVFYNIFVLLAVFLGAFLPVPFLWEFSDFVLVCVAVPHIVGLLFLSFKYSYILDF